ncbi:glucose-6-phosphate 1-dehydrogenase [Terriglobus roseus DSM 18391]|uniref:Glucose-6-phosphate 1-dehydrogenase n=1 Tax=Terriglobus roseus (strain DSM 18391 / NRRL B-41598 / KBS 63) TaxID=926566 RepID=I3ZDK1_TERRK|nr:glucose-6-phosphate dehydrogenase [Terriglobus roseus]AFL87319.1 glucose-6-phosphate 1-dehydrogenase [Terriglobus roseus DSM 18391]
MATTGINVSQEQVEANKCKENIPEPCIVVIFGASGDLTKRKLLPALYHLEQSNLLPTDFAVVGVARRDLSATFAHDMHDGILAGGGVDKDEAKLDKFMERVQYFATEFDNDEGFEKLKAFLADLDKKFGTKGNRLFYLAVAPEFFADITQRLGKHGMTGEEGGGWVRVIIEKPFGTDLESAKKLNSEVNSVLHEDQIFRIDHYLGKETVQNILVFRFGNGIFEPIWNRNYIDSVQITAAESIGIEGRGPFYEAAGALRDVLQNHVMEVLSFVAMEPPDSFEADAVRFEKLKVWKAIEPIRVEDTARGQYGPGRVGDRPVVGYREEERVSKESQTETYAAMKLEIENWRWAGVPFYIRAAKRLEKRVTEVVITFRQPPLHLFKGSSNKGMESNVLTLRIQPDDGISLKFGAKLPGPTTNVAQVEMNFSYADAFGKSSANGYERLLLDAMLGDGTLFAEREGVETTWALMTPILEAWKAQKVDFPNYEAGSWGPKEADELLARDGRAWKV